MKHRVWIAAGLFLVLSLVLAGCGNRITAEEIVAKMQETVENTQDAHAVVSASVNVQGIEISATAEVTATEVGADIEPLHFADTVLEPGPEAARTW